MLVVMEQGATPEQIAAVEACIRELGYAPHTLPGATRTAIGVTGNQGPVGASRIESLPGVLRIIHVTKPYKLVSREFKHEDTIVAVGAASGRQVAIGGKKAVVMAGPCAVESPAQAMTIGRAVKAAGADILRGGAFKPRTSPYSFQGLGEEGLKILADVRAETGLPIVTEAIDERSMELVQEYADVIQIGARNMQNFALLRLAGKARKPVLLKRGMSATLDELLLAAEYVLSEGNWQVILCERGVRTFADHSRNTLDLSVVPAVKRISHLPIVVDPSHGTGKREKVIPLSRAAIAVGADGVMVEVHHCPEKALSDGPQSIVPEQFCQLMDELRRLAPAMGREL